MRKTPKINGRGVFAGLTGTKDAFNQTNATAIPIETKSLLKASSQKFLTPISRSQTQRFSKLDSFD